MKTWWAIAFAIVASLLGAGVLILVTSPPRGVPIPLVPAPSSEPMRIHVAGAVLHPGVYSLPYGSRVEDALQAAGGLADGADVQSMNLVILLKDGERVAVPTLRSASSASPPVSGTGSSTSVPGGTSASQGLTPQFPININTATVEELDALPGIGPVTAQKILDYRMQNGSFQSVDELDNVAGIGPATIEKIRSLIVLGP